MTFSVSLNSFHEEFFGQDGITVRQDRTNTRLHVMTSLTHLLFRLDFRVHTGVIGLLIATFILLSGSSLQAQNPHEVTSSGITYFNDFSLNHDANEARGLSIGVDLLNTDNFNYSASESPMTSLNFSTANSPNLFRSSILLMGIIFILVTFSQGIISLLKKAGRTPAPVGMISEV